MKGIFTPPMLTRFLEIIRDNKKLYLSAPFHLVLIITNLKNFVKYISEQYISEHSPDCRFWSKPATHSG